MLVQFELAAEWSTESVDLCWMDCPDAGFLLRPVDVIGYEIVLCVRHARDLEAARGGTTYSLADPPAQPTKAKWWPWQQRADERWAA